MVKIKSRRNASCCISLADGVSGGKIVMNKAQNTKFSGLVGHRLTSEEARSLWIPMAQEFDRDGPDAAKKYLEAEKQRLEEYVKSLLNSIEGS